MATIGIIFLVIIAFIVLGVFGWIIKGIGVILEFLIDGCLESFGCLIWVFLIIVLIVAMFQ